MVLNSERGMSTRKSEFGSCASSVEMSLLYGTTTSAAKAGWAKPAETVGQGVADK